MALAPTSISGPRVVVIGGGNGTSRLLESLLPFLQEEKIASLHAIVQMADDGGSTGRLREQYAVGAMGDLTKCLLALSPLRGDVRGEKFLHALDYRFADGDFGGHTLRNAVLTALELTSDLDAAIATFARILQIPKYAGVIPSTLQPVTQQVIIKGAEEEAVLGEGEHFIAHNVNLQIAPHDKPGDVLVKFKETHIPLNPRAKRALKEATHIIVSPGHTFGSILPALASLQLDPEFSMEDVMAKRIVVMTLLTTPHQTSHWSGEDFVQVYESYLGKPVNTVIANTARADVPLVEGQEWVAFDEEEHAYELISAELAKVEQKAPQVGDTVPRAVVIHDPQQMKDIFSKLLK